MVVRCICSGHSYPFTFYRHLSLIFATDSKMKMSLLRCLPHLLIVASVLATRASCVIGNEHHTQVASHACSPSRKAVIVFGQNIARGREPVVVFGQNIAVGTAPSDSPIRHSISSTEHQAGSSVAERPSPQSSVAHATPTEVVASGTRPTKKRGRPTELSTEAKHRRKGQRDRVFYDKRIAKAHECYDCPVGRGEKVPRKIHETTAPRLTSEYGKSQEEFEKEHIFTRARYGLPDDVLKVRVARKWYEAEDEMTNGDHLALHGRKPLTNDTMNRLRDLGARRKLREKGLR